MRAGRHRLEDLLAAMAERGLSLLPARLADPVGAGLGTVAGRALKVRRTVAEDNLRGAFPDASDAWIRATASAAYAHLGREALATLRLSRAGAPEIRRRTTVHGLESLQSAMAEGRGAILATGHLGNWEVGAAAIAARGMPFSALVRRQSNAHFDARLERLRQRLGIETIDADRGPRGVVAALRRNRVVGIVGDQDARAAGSWIPFLGRWSSTYRGPGYFARRMDAPAIAAACLRRVRMEGEVGYDLHLAPVPVPRTASMEADIDAVLQGVSRHLERFIRAFPSQYFWFHRRWKTAPPAELTAPPPGTTGSAES